MNVTSSTSSADASSSASSSSSSSSGSADGLGEDQFLQLLTAQLQNQDPLNPMDDSAFVAQLAQFSSVEQLTTVNSNLDQLLVSQTSGNQTATAGLIGKDVLYSSNDVTLGASGGATLYANLASAASNVTATITNSSGDVVRTIQLGSEPAGSLQTPWDGLDNNGNPLPPGTYTVSMNATDASGNAVTVTQEQEGLVTGVNFSAGYPQLLVNGQQISLSNIVELDAASTTTP
jgi:flagellar basal-body rod modification protein FlgD